MKKLLGVVLGLAIALAVVGLLRGWFSFSKTDEETKTNIQLTIDRERIKEDVDSARDKAGQLGDRIGGDSGEAQPDTLEFPESTDPYSGPQ